MALSDFINSVKKGYEATNDVINIAKDKYQQVENQIDKVKEMKQKRDMEKAKEKILVLERKIQNCIVSNPGIIMREGEICYYQGKAVAMKIKNAVVGTVRSSQHVGIHGHYAYSGQGMSVAQSIRGEVIDRSKGHFYITNKRFVLNTIRNGFEIPLDKLTGIEFYKDGLVVFSKGTSYVVESKDVNKIKRFIEINNEYEALRISINIECKNEITERKDINEEKNNMELLREYKCLMDEGIITEEEFQQKKKELLNIK